MWDIVRRNIKLDQDEFIDIGPLKRDSVFLYGRSHILKRSQKFVWVVR